MAGEHKTPKMRALARSRAKKRTSAAAGDGISSKSLLWLCEGAARENN